MKILGLIPARAGSKGVPGKNTKLLHGKSLIQRAFECARDAGVLDRIILSSDDESAIALAHSIGLDVPFVRPRDLARDETAMLDVAIHAVNTLEELGYSADALLLLQPTSPLRHSEQIRAAVNLLGDCDSVCSVVPVPQDLSPYYVMRLTPAGFLDFYLPDGSRYTRRQDVPLAYRRDGTIFLTRTSVLLKEKTFYGRRCMPMILTEGETLNIDSLEDWAEAEQLLKPAA